MKDENGLTPLHVTSRKGSAGVAGVKAIFEAMRRVNDEQQTRGDKRMYDIGEMAISQTNNNKRLFTWQPSLATSKSSKSCCSTLKV
jgi:hypothetical protein